MNSNGMDAVTTELTVRAEQIRMIYHQGTPIQLLGLGTAILAASMLSGVADLTLLLAWLSCMFILTAIRVTLVYRFSRVSESSLDLEPWATRYILGTFASGLLWGALSLFYEHNWPIAQQVVLFVIYTGLIASAFNANSSVRWAYPAFFLPPVLMLMYVILSQTDDAGNFGMLALLFTIYIIQLTISSRRHYQRVTDSLRIRVVNEALANALELSNQRLIKLSEMDELTKLYNRRSMERFLKEEWERHTRSATPFSLLYIDIDYFKQYNDTYGHLGGDEVLVRVASVFERYAQRATDMAARFGGEEFAIILPETDHTDALRIAENIRCAVERLKIPHASSRIADTITVSIGVATVSPRPNADQEELKLEADRALYAAKEQGRNRIAGRDRNSAGNTGTAVFLECCSG
jgi:diguanylate cyclase (GGDEF)-like protein